MRWVVRTIVVDYCIEALYLARHYWQDLHRSLLTVAIFLICTGRSQQLIIIITTVLHEYITFCPVMKELLKWKMIIRAYSVKSYQGTPVAAPFFVSQSADHSGSQAVSRTHSLYPQSHSSANRWTKRV